MATARQCDSRRKISASKRWLFVKCKYLEAVEVENMKEPSKVHCGTTRIPGSLSELLGVMSCMAIKAAVWCLGIRRIRS